MQNKNLKQKRTGIAIAGLAAAAMFAAAVPATQVYASGDETATVAADLPLIEVSIQDASPLETIKKSLIELKASTDDSIDLNAVDIAASQIDLQGFDRSASGIQTVTARLSLAESSEETADIKKSLGYTFVQNATVKMVKSSAPQLKLKADSVTVNNGDTWNAASYISYINDDSGILPALIVEGNVDMSTDGDYYVTYTAIDIEGNKSEADLTVSVKTPEEVIRAREEAERLAAEAAAAEAERLAQEQREREEAERRAAEEAAAAEAERQALLAAESAGSGTPLTGTADNPYYGGWSNCAYGAWQLAHNLSGVNLPSWGYAGGWLYSAQASGYATGTAPAAGSIAVYTGHVAYVSAVDGDMVYIMEGGFNGGYNERWVNKDYIYGQSLQGYIYLP
jgi:surface antigen